MSTHNIYFRSLKRSVVRNKTEGLHPKETLQLSETDRRLIDSLVFLYKYITFPNIVSISPFTSIYKSPYHLYKYITSPILSPYHVLQVYTSLRITYTSI